MGAILVQRTSWANAERAITQLREQQLLEPDPIVGAGAAALKSLIRPAGFVHAKSEYLSAFAVFFLEHGGIDGLSRNSTAELRTLLLSVHGVGPETADSILLYVFNRPVWIVDQYATRIFSRLNGRHFEAAAQSELLADWIHAGRTADLQELHALIVAHGKEHCRARPRCQGCPLRISCDHARRHSDDGITTATVR